MSWRGIQEGGLIIRSIVPQDIERNRLDSLIQKRIKTLPRIAQLTESNVYEWLTKVKALPGAEIIVAEDPLRTQLPGVFVAVPTNLLGDSVALMADLMIVCTDPTALRMMAEEMERRAKENGCKGMMMTCEASNSDAASRWASRFGMHLVAMTCFKEI